MKTQIKTTLIASFFMAFVGLTGCANTYTSDDDGFNLAELETLVKVNETTADDLRKLFREPTISGVTLEGDTVIAYSFRSDNMGPTALAATATLGLARLSVPHTDKVAYFKLDGNGKVVEIKKKGYAYLLHELYSKCEVELTDGEINSPVTYTSSSELCQRYKTEVAQRKGIDPKDVDEDEKFFRCDVTCHAIRGAKKLFGQFRFFKGNFDYKKGDGDRAKETVILHNRK